MEGLEQAKFKNVEAAQGPRGESMAGGNYYCVSRVNVYNELAVTTSNVTNRPLNISSSPMKEKSAGKRPALAAGSLRYQAPIQSRE